MKSVGMAIALMAAGAVFAGADAQPALLWETTGLKTPESALAVPAEGFAYVSNVAGKPTDKDGNGFISKVSLADGKIIALEWAKGMDAPKGLALAGGKLYASDIDKLVEIDPARRARSRRSMTRQGQQFLNDVAADAAGQRLRLRFQHQHHLASRRRQVREVARGSGAEVSQRPHV